jgi:hypothetical protein
MSWEATSNNGAQFILQERSDTLESTTVAASLANASRTANEGFCVASGVAACGLEFGVEDDGFGFGIVAVIVDYVDYLVLGVVWSVGGVWHTVRSIEVG